MSQHSDSGRKDLEQPGELLCPCTSWKAEESWFLCQQRKAAAWIDEQDVKMAKIVNLKGMRATYPPIHLCICLINLKKKSTAVWVPGIFLVLYTRDAFKIENSHVCLYFFLLSSTAFTADAVLVFKSPLVPSSYICCKSLLQGLWTLLATFPKYYPSACFIAWTVEVRARHQVKTGREEF